MDFITYIKNRELRQAYDVFTKDALIDLIIDKNKQIKELQQKLNDKNK